MSFTEKMVVAKISPNKAMHSGKVIQANEKLCCSTFSVNPVYYVNPMSVRVMHDCTVVCLITAT